MTKDTLLDFWSISGNMQCLKVETSNPVESRFIYNKIIYISQLGFDIVEVFQ